MIGYLGPEGTFSHQAAMECSNGEALKEYGSIAMLIDAVDDMKIEKAIVPIENSIEGGVNITSDALALVNDVYITGEHILKVSQNLMVKKGTCKQDIRVVASHIQSLGQCAKMLDEEFPDVRRIAAVSTADAAKKTLESDGSVACIGSQACAKIYGLEILKKDCADDKNNKTRFVLIEKKPCKKITDHDKTSVAFTLDNKSGTLYNALKIFADDKINMVKIESRPVKNELGRYIFLVDIEGNIDESKIYFALNKLRKSTDYYKFLGSYEVSV